MCPEEAMKNLGLLDVRYGRRVDGGADSDGLQVGLRFLPCIAR